MTSASAVSPPWRRSAGLAATALAAGLLVAPGGPLDLALAPTTAPAAAHTVPSTPAGLPSAIEPLAAYEPQTSCVVESEGARRLARLVLSTYPSTGSGGIVRDCTLGGASEHKEGRAWDWSVDSTDTTEVAYGEAFLEWLLAPDAAGNSYAMARRLGVMYVVWDEQIWSAERASSGWRPYTGRDSHRAHMHISLSPAGGRAETSFWTGRVASGTSTQKSSTTTTSSETSRAASDVGDVLREGARGEGVRELQRLLGVAADGAFGPSTLAALTSWQDDQDLVPDGVAGPSTWRALQGAAAPSTASTGSTLRLGDTGAVVMDLQSALGLAGDGTFGPRTEAAVVAVQEGAGLVADGVVGPRTWSVVRSSGASIAPLTGTDQGRPTLQEGDEGSAVAEAQRLLGLRADGGYGARTTAAVTAVQRGAGLTADGVLGPRTWAVLG